MRVATEDLQSHWATLGPMLVIRSEDDYERAVEHLNQLLDYVGAHIRRSRGRERNGLSAGPARAEGLNCNFQAQVIGPKIVAPG